MSKVFVDRELLERVTNMLDAHNYAKDAEALMAAIAQPAEAEGAGLRAMSAGEWAERAPSRNVVLEDEAIAALSAVTAERDRLRDQVKALQSDANSWQSGYDKGRHDGTKHRHSEVAQLRAEVEALRPDAERYRWLAKRDRWASLLVDFDRNSTYRRHRVVFFTGDAWPQVEGQTIDEAVDAAIAAQGGE